MARLRVRMLLPLVFFAVSAYLRPQSFNASISGTVLDPSGAAIPNVQLTLRAVGSGATARAMSGQDGLFSFPNLTSGAYELTAQASSFRDFVQRGILVRINESIRLDVKLELGSTTQTVEVSANASPLNFENAQLVQGISPETIRDLPLLISGAIRSVAQFAVIMPGVSTGAGNSAFDARINGGMQSSDEAVVDGATMVDGMNSQSGMTEAYTDHPLSPDAISEISLLTSNYEPQYGNTTSSVITAVTKSGTTNFRGSLYEFLRNNVLNARSYGAPQVPKDIENDFGGTIGGPVKLPLAWTGRKKTFFFASYEIFHIRGGTISPIISIPSLKERQGDFSDWVGPDGLIPVYDPATLRPNPNYNSDQPEGLNNLPYLRDQFMGCDGNTPNVICPSDPRLQNSLAQQWLQFLPNPTYQGSLNNYVVPVPVRTTSFADSSLLDLRVDHYIGDKDHISAVVHYRGNGMHAASLLPPMLATEGKGAWAHGYLNRLNWDHTFSPTILNHATFGYNVNNGRQVCVSTPYVDQVPQIAGVVHHQTPVLTFQGFQSFGCNYDDKDAKPVYTVNDLLTWVRGKHTLKFGGEIRRLMRNEVTYLNESGTFNFGPSQTGLLGINSGNSIASFLLEQVDSASAQFQTVATYYPRQNAWSAHIGDTWKITPKLSINYGVRWDVFTPSIDKLDNLSFLDPVGVNPGAGNRPGRLAFAGTKWGAASFGRRHPEETWYRGFAPRVGFAYSLTPKSVVRAGYGVFYGNAYYPGWGGGMSWDGFNTTASFSAPQSGLASAMVLSEGFPQNFPQPPFIDPAADNGLSSIMYRPFDANRLPYAQQWNLTIEHQITNDFYINTAYVGNKGTRLLSTVAPLNALNPNLLSMGQQLYDEFQPGQTSLDGVPVPYPGWVDQMTGCAPTVAQALLPYPQYCSSLYGLNENAGSSTYHSFQLKAEKRFSHGMWLLGSYTISKLLTNSDNVQTGASTWGGASGVISPYERQRNKALSQDDVPQVLSLSFVYQLPFGKGQKFLNRGGVVEKLLVTGWQLTGIFRASSPPPLFFRSSNCNVPGQFAAGCIPAILPGANPWAQEKGHFDASKPLLNNAAFEGPNGFNFYFGQGPRISNLRGFGYHNQDFGLTKNTPMTERVTLQFRAEFFNVWNWHIFACQSQCFGNSAFTNDLSSPAFGMWNGAISAPRNIQFGMKLLF